MSPEVLASELRARTTATNSIRADREKHDGRGEDDTRAAATVEDCTMC